ncbi:MAG TPA: potassium channel family protein [Candidatus Saccharimonadales bacterium]|nr:potassium channel family protein [Candidatus Saccharimonadales bacterium]
MAHSKSGKHATADAEAEFMRIRRQFREVAAAALLVLTLGAVFYHFVEHFSWVNSFYFCTITLTTIGYGDVVPHTTAGKLFTIFYVLIGIGILAFFGNLLVRNAVARREYRRTRKPSSRW